MASQMPLIVIDGYIGEDENVDAGAIINAISDLKAQGVEKAQMRINSGGGDMMQGFAIYDAMIESGIEFTGHIIGLCGSMATVLVMGCSHIKMSKNAMMMFHQAKSGLHGTADELRNMAELTDKLEAKALAIYTQRTGQTEEIVKSWLVPGKDTWMTAQEALANKVINEIVESSTPFKPAVMTTESEVWNKVYSKANIQPPNKMTKEQLSAVGLPEEATQAQYDAKIAELVSARKTAEDKLSAELKAKANTLVENAVKDGKVKVEAKAEMLSFAESNYEGAKKVIENMNVRQLPSNYIAPGSNPQGGNPQGADRSNWTMSDWRKKDIAGLLKMKVENRAAYDSLFAATGVKITQKDS